MTENLKNMTDDEVINYINTIVTDNIDLEIADLKAVLAEASGRKLEKKYINIIAERIKSKIQPDPVPVKRNQEPPKEEKTVAEPVVTKPSFDDVYQTDEDDEDERTEKYPVLSFLIGLYKVFAWILLIGSIVIAGIISLLVFKEQIAVVCGIMFSSIVVGVFLLIAFYSMAESIKIKIDIEQHLNDLLLK